MSLMKLEHDPDPESINQGDEIERAVSYCAICFNRIYAPILDGIWYHGRGKKSIENHEPIPANNFVQLFLEYENDKGTLLKISRYDDKESLACPCYLKWFNLLKKDVEAGFYGEHYYDENGITLCKTYLIRLTNEAITDPNYPEKQEYNCEKCILLLKKQKILKIITPTGKNKNVIYNRIEWLKK